MSDSEEENFCFFGTPLDPYDEDSFPKKKPIALEEQIATDAQGRRRFHGAFTGGFSAGFFNTVGSLEGWAPSEFKSSRQDKAKNVLQKPEDFMDDEDVAEHGIAHQTIRATSEYSTVKKRKRQLYSDGPIPGEPVLQTLLTAGNETVGYLLLKNIGIRDKLNKQEELSPSETKIYGCEIPTQYKIPENIENRQYQIPEIYTEYLQNPKSNTFGLGYQGLDKSHINLFQSSNLVIKERNNKKFSVTGQAFGVGAFEEEDEDIYVKEDMSKYDFELTQEKKSNKSGPDTDDLIFGIFRQSQRPLVFKKLYAAPTIPHSFTGKHKVRKSRFEPTSDDTNTADRREINPIIRAKYLGEMIDESYTESKPVLESFTDKVTETDIPQNEFDMSSLLNSDRFVAASQKEDISSILEPVKKFESTHGTEELREAARMKMYGLLTRTTMDWHPCAILCKRFNVPEPYLERGAGDSKKRTKNLIFEYQKHNQEVTLKPGLSQPDEDKHQFVTDDLKIEITDEATAKHNLEQDDVEQTSGILAQENETESILKDITEKVGVEEKTDLFKAVFLSSSESESEEDETSKDKDKLEEFKSNLLSEQLIPKIKPMKEGILSNVNFQTFSIPENNLQQTEIESQLPTSSSKDNDTELSLYGPQLPSQKLTVKSEANIPILSGDSDDEWVEKDGLKKKDEFRKKKKIKHKKHKKEKHKKHKNDKEKSKKM